MAMVLDPSCSVSSTEHGLTGRKIFGKETGLPFETLTLPRNIEFAKRF